MSGMFHDKDTLTYVGVFVFFILLAFFSSSTGFFGLNDVEVSLDEEKFNLLLDSQEENLNTAVDLIDIKNRFIGTERVVEGAKLASKRQLNVMGYNLKSIEHASYSSPSEAVYSLVNAMDPNYQFTEKQIESIENLDTIGPEERRALIDYIASLESYYKEQDKFYRSIDITDEDFQIDTSLTGKEVDQEFTFYRDNGIDPSGLISSRNDLLDSVSVLDVSITSSDSCEGELPVDLSPYIYIDLDSCDNVYNEDYNFLFDSGGDDIYYNNAGGANEDLRVSAFVDMSGNDVYNNSGGNAVNGGAKGIGSAGFLFDGDGDDIYNAGSDGVNGGGRNIGFGMLVDSFGKDVYESDGSGSNGGGYRGSGVLVDGQGNNSYKSGNRGTNGGANELGFGSLISFGEGNDSYTATKGGVNGGGAGGPLIFGNGFLVDLGGNDVFIADRNGVNGGSQDLGTGFLFNYGGIDRYESNHRGANGGSDNIGSALLIDIEGDGDTYQDSNNPTGAGTDISLFPKGFLGAQIDDSNPLYIQFIAGKIEKISELLPL